MLSIQELLEKLDGYGLVITDNDDILDRLKDLDLMDAVVVESNESDGA